MGGKDSALCSGGLSADPAADLAIRKELRLNRKSIKKEKRERRGARGGNDQHGAWVRGSFELCIAQKFRPPYAAQRTANAAR